jgi:hypothetical protein
VQGAAASCIRRIVKPRSLLILIALVMAACGDSSAETLPTPAPATTALQPATPELAGLSLEVHAEPG